MSRRRPPSFFSACMLALALVLLVVGPSNALPLDVERPHHILRRNLHRRATVTQSALGSFQTVSTEDTPVGETIQTCTITLTPIVVNGKSEVVEVESCTVSVNNSTNASPPPPAPPNGQPQQPPPSSSSSSSPSTSSTAPAVVATSTTSSSANPPVTTPPPTATSSADEGDDGTSTSADASETTDGAVSVDGFSTVPSVPTPASATVRASPTVSPSPSDAGDTSPSAAAAAESPSSSAQTAFTLPGKKLSVLPIGLAVFAGISVIALIVVGLVTYERTKYRKAFRERKLAESNSPGYGGTSTQI